MAATKNTTTYSNPPIFTDVEKFDGTNWMDWSKAILVATCLCGAKGYLEGKVNIPTKITTIGAPTTVNPTTTTTTTTTTAMTDTATTTPTVTTETPWTSLTPYDEYNIRDAWTMVLLRYNIKNPTGLGVKTNGSAAEAWSSLVSQYKITTDLALINAQWDLCNIIFHDGDDLFMHIANLRTKWAKANSVGAVITDSGFRMILLQSLPASWDSLVVTLDTHKTSADVIACINRSAKISTPNTSATALKVEAKRTAWNKLICTNKNCGRHGHLIEDCYWEGGGKEGKFPPGFGQRGGATGSASSTVSSTSTQSTSVTAKAADAKTTYALMAISNALNETSAYSILGNTETDVPRVSYIPDEGLNIRALMANVEDISVFTYADSGASDHCFANKNDFSSYTEFSEPRKGQAASKSAQFKILGKGTITKEYYSDGKSTKLTFQNALHTPDFAANLVSISRFDIADFTILFGAGEAVFNDPRGKAFVSAKRVCGMYVLSEALSTAMPAQSHKKPVTIDGWHRRFAHAGISAIRELKTKNLVDGLDITDGESLPGACEDCIYGKQTSRPYNKVVTPEMDVLERVHIDLWGPSRVQSIGEANYMMLFTDGGSSFKKPYFLSEKSAEVTLQALKDYKIEAETQTGRKLKTIRVDMGKEFINKAIEDFCRENGIVIESTAPYAHASNGVAEQAN